MAPRKKIGLLVGAGCVMVGAILVLRTQIGREVAQGREGDQARVSRSEHPRSELDKGKERAGSKTKDESPEISDIGTARELINDFFSKNKDVGDRSIFVSRLIARLCKEGNPNLAWELIDAGSGTIRDAGLSSFFKNAELPREELFKRIVDLPYRSDPGNAFSGFVERLKVNELESFFATGETRALLKNSSLVLNSSGAVSLALEMAILEGGKADDILSVGIKLAQSGNFDNASIIKLIRENSTKDVFEQWKIIDPLGTSSRFGQLAENSRKELIRDMVSSDATQTVNILLGSGGHSDGDLKVAIENWSQIDSAGTKNWYDANKTKLTERQQGSVATAISERALDHLEFDGARTWAAEISDETARSQLLAKIDSKELEGQKAREEGRK